MLPTGEYPLRSSFISACNSSPGKFSLLLTPEITCSSLKPGILLYFLHQITDQLGATFVCIKNTCLLDSGYYCFCSPHNQANFD